MYYLGQDTTTVKPVTRRRTWTRHAPQRALKTYLQRSGRCPINRRGYPTAGIPVSAAPMQGLSLGASVTEAFKIPALTTSFTPSPMPMVPATQPSSVWSPITSLLNLWNDRPQVLKDIRLNVDPNAAMRALQTAVKPGQVGGVVDWLKAKGVTTSYKNVPLTGQQAAWGYEAAGIDWMSYLPWIIGGGAALLLLPKLMGRR